MHHLDEDEVKEIMEGLPTKCRKETGGNGKEKTEGEYTSAQNTVKAYEKEQLKQF